MQKKISFPLLAASTGIALALGVSAFSDQKSKPPLVNDHPSFATAYYHLSTDNASDENTLSKWVYDGATPSTCSPGTAVLCTVLAPDKIVGSTHVIDPAFLSSPINMRTDPNVSNRTKKP